MLADLFSYLKISQNLLCGSLLGSGGGVHCLYNIVQKINVELLIEIQQLTRNLGATWNNCPAAVHRCRKRHSETSSSPPTLAHVLPCAVSGV